MSRINFELNVLAASRYHVFLSKNLKSRWLDIFHEIENSSEMGIPEILVLLHPRWHLELDFSSSNDPRGLNSFSGAFPLAKCRAIEIWGYECPYKEMKIHIDHTFPYSRGGSTKSDNAMYLCQEHNLSKSTDLHLLPWESFPSKKWIKDELEIFISMATRKSKNGLYFPEKQFLRV
jgi:hypothetical protein